MSKLHHDILLQYDDNYGLDSKKLQLYSDSDDSSTTTTATTIIIIDNDINNIKSIVFNLLKLKFENQQLGKKLWLENRELKHYEFIPIEFSKDSYFVNNFIKRMIDNEEQYPYFHHWYQYYCFDILNDELKMEIDVVLGSELAIFNNENDTPSISLINRINRICNQSETKCIEIIYHFATEVGDIDSFIKKYKNVFPFIEKVLNNEEFLLKCISSNYEVFSFIRSKFKKKQEGENQLELALKCVNANANVLQYFNNSSNFSSIFTDKQVVMKVIQSIDMNRGVSADYYFSHLPNNLKNDREVVLIASEKGCPVLSHINSEELKNDREIVLNSVRYDGFSLEYASDQFKNDREIVLGSVIGHSFEYASDILKNDRDIVLKASEKGCPVLEYINSEELKNDREIVLNSVRNNGLSLEYAPDKFKNDREVVTEAVKQWYDSLQHASDDLKNDREFIVEMITKFNAHLGDASKLLQQDRELILSAIKMHPFNTLHSDVSNELLLNREFILECVKGNGLCLKYLPPFYQSDYEIVNEAIKQNPFSICDVDISGMDCKNALLYAVELIHLDNADDTFEYMDLLNSIDDLDVAKKLIETVPFSIHFLTESFRENYQELTFKATLLHNGYWMKHSEDAYQERINHTYYSAKIDSNSNGGAGGDEINYYRNVNKTNLLWKDLKWKEWEY